MIPSFSFEDAGRSFACHVEHAQTRDMTLWWWFTVSSDHHRYAPFHASVGDTEESVRSRVVAFYDALLARRAAPSEPHRRLGRPPGTTTPACGSINAADQADEGLQRRT